MSRFKISHKRRKTKSGHHSRASSSLSSYDEETSDWAFLGAVSLNAWKLGDAEVYGFDLFENWYVHNLRVQKKPWSTFHVLGKTAKGKKETKICSFPCEVEETGREERVSWWIKSMNVLAMNSRVIVVQIVLSKALKILVVNWHTEKLLGTYTFAYSEEPCVQECFISPNSEVLFLRQNFYLRRMMGHMTNFDPNIRVLRVNSGLCERLRIIEDTSAFNCFGSGISFDPRFPEGRAVIVSSTIQSVSDPDAAVQIYDVPMQLIVQTTEAVTDRIIHHMKHSPDGSLIAILCITMSSASFTTIFVDSILILNSDSLRTLNMISLPNCGPVKPLQANAFPTFSRNGHYLAQLYVDSAYHVNIYQMPVTEMSLQCFCRSVILHYTPHRYLDHLPLPKKLIGYLQFKFD